MLYISLQNICKTVCRSAVDLQTLTDLDDVNTTEPGTAELSSLPVPISTDQHIR